MAGIEIASVVKAGFSLVASVRGDELVIELSGNADMEATPVLEGYMRDLHQDILRSGLRKVAFDFAGLDFMNSSSFKCFVAWINVVSKMPVEQRYDVRFLSNPEVHWQRRSLEALHRFAPEVVTLEPLR